MTSQLGHWAESHKGGDRHEYHPKLQHHSSLEGWKTLNLLWTASSPCSIHWGACILDAPNNHYGTANSFWDSNKSMLYTYSVLLSCKFYTLLFSWYISYGSDEENLTWSKQFFFVIISFILPTNFFFFLNKQWYFKGENNYDAGYWWSQWDSQWLTGSRNYRD